MSSTYTYTLEQPSAPRTTAIYRKPYILVLKLSNLTIRFSRTIQHIQFVDRQSVLKRDRWIKIHAMVVPTILVPPKVHH